MNSTVNELLRGRDNNFNLIRFLAAFAVIYDHSFMVPNGGEVPWIIHGINTGDFGWYAVNIFFILSGFLVTKSWHSHQDILSFLFARLLRIFPALTMAAFVMAFVVGPLVCLCLITHYFADVQTWTYIPLTASLITPHAELHSVFEHAPMKSVVNSPLWTLRYEVISYAALAGLGVLGLFATRQRALASILFFFVGYLFVTLVTDWRDDSVFLDSLMRFWLCFFLGTTAYLLSDRLIFRATAALVLLVGASLTYGTVLYELALQLALVYGILWVALVPGGSIRKFNELGDYSYGLYIFAWPVQQTAILLFPGLSPHELLVLVLPIVIAISMFSWHWIELPAIKIHSAVRHWVTDRVVAFGR